MLGTNSAKISEAYQVLSNEELRKQYDKYGKERAVPDSGFGTWPFVCIFETLEYVH